MVQMKAVLMSKLFAGNTLIVIHTYIPATVRNYCYLRVEGMRKGKSIIRVQRAGIMEEDYSVGVIVLEY